MTETWTDRQTDTCPPIHVQTGNYFYALFDTFFHFTTFPLPTLFMKDELLWPGSTVVEHLAHNPNIEGSNHEREKKSPKKHLLRRAALKSEVKFQKMKLRRTFFNVSR
jgi:hypothetical protein